MKLNEVKMRKLFVSEAWFGRPQRSPTFGPTKTNLSRKLSENRNSRAETFLWFVPEVAASPKFRPSHGLQSKSFSLPISVICTGVVPRHGNHFWNSIFWFSDFWFFDFWRRVQRKGPKRGLRGPPKQGVRTTISNDVAFFEPAGSLATLLMPFWSMIISLLIGNRILILLQPDFTFSSSQGHW